MPEITSVDSAQIEAYRLFLKLPVFGDLVNKSCIARWTRG